MKSKTTYTRKEADEVIDLIRQKLKADTTQQKSIRAKIRRLGFHASDFDFEPGYTVEDFLSVTKVIDYEKNEKILELIEKYKENLKKNGLQDEVYKWNLIGEFQGRYNLESVSFQDEINQVNLGNVIYHLAIAVMKHIVAEREEDYRQCFKKLYDENTPLEDRIARFNEETLAIYREVHDDDKVSHHHDERTISTLLTFKYPNSYTFYKNSFYRKYCNLIGIKSETKKNKKYPHYLTLIDSLIDNYIKEDHELLELVSELIPSNSFNDINHKILAQDILYTTLDKLESKKKRYWRVGTTDGNLSHWDMMKNNSKVAIGWPKLGDLEKKGVKGKQEIDELMKELGYSSNDNKVRSRKAGEIYNFFNEISEGDIVLAQDGQSILGIGMVENEYEFNNEDPFPHQRPVEWKVYNPSFNNSIGNQTTVYEIADNEIINMIEQVLRKDTNQMNPIESLLKSKKQIILQGPPGTGKTYTAKDIAESIIFGEVSNDKSKQKKRLESTDQFTLVQFHPSYSYEDFVRGIVTQVENDQVVYKVESKTLGKLAQKALPYSTPINLRNDNFAERYRLFIEKQIRIKKKTGKDYFFNEEKSIRLLDIHPQGSLGKLRFETLSEHGDWVMDTWLDFARTFDANVYYNALIQDNSPEYFIKKDFQECIKNIPLTYKSFVLVIDEINRANLPTVLGELIYALEYRNEEVESMYAINGDNSIVLPDNLYIIGTMNTADRSVGHIDYAIKRRFAFVDVLPDESVIENKAAKDLFRKVSKLFLTEKEGSKENSDYLAPDFNFKDIQLGHSYFILKPGTEEEQQEELKMKLEYEILPILNEYVKDGILLDEAKEEISKLTL